jgi:hypothetical protein
MREPSRQPSTVGPFERHAVSLPAQLVAAAREEMRARGISSFSAYVAEAIRRDLESRKFDELLDEMFREQPLSEEERACAKRNLYG